MLEPFGCDAGEMKQRTMGDRRSMQAQVSIESSIAGTC